MFSKIKVYFITLLWLVAEEGVYNNNLELKLCLKYNKEKGEVKRKEMNRWKGKRWG